MITAIAAVEKALGVAELSRRTGLPIHVVRLRLDQLAVDLVARTYPFQHRRLPAHHLHEFCRRLEAAGYRLPLSASDATVPPGAKDNRGAVSS